MYKYFDNNKILEDHYLVFNYHIPTTVSSDVLSVSPCVRVTLTITILKCRWSPIAYGNFSRCFLTNCVSGHKSKEKYENLHFYCLCLLDYTLETCVGKTDVYLCFYSSTLCNNWPVWCVGPAGLKIVLRKCTGAKVIC